MKTSLRALLAPPVIAAALLAGCGGDDDSSSDDGSDAAGLAAVKTYLTDHSSELVENVDALNAAAQDYYSLAEQADFDYAALLKERCEAVDTALTQAKDAFVAANPAYEEMEGIVAGVPSLAHYDVDIDAGAGMSGPPEDRVSFSLSLPGGKEMKQPGNLFFLAETALYGTNPDLTVEGVKPDVDCDGKVEFGEGLPDAQILKATMDEFVSQANSLNTDAAEFEPTPSDAFTAIVVMTPTMSEYFEQWKNSAFVAGAGKASEEGFVATSRLSDIADILSGIVFTYDEVEELIAEESPQQAQQTKRELSRLASTANDLRDREQEGEQFTARQADQFGAQMQAQAEAIAGQVTQAAQAAGIQIQES